MQPELFITFKNVSWAGLWSVTVAFSGPISYHGLVTVDNLCFVIPLSNKRRSLSTLVHKWFDLSVCGCLFHTTDRQ